MSVDVKQFLKSVSDLYQSYGYIRQMEVRNIHSEEFIDGLKKRGLFPFMKERINRNLLMCGPESTNFITKEMLELTGCPYYALHQNVNITLEEAVNFCIRKSDEYFRLSFWFDLNKYKRSSYKSVYKVLSNGPINPDTIQIRIFQTHPISKQEKKYFNKLRTLDNPHFDVNFHKDISNNMVYAYNTILTFIKN